jgi:hypothetical protein
LTTTKKNEKRNTRAPVIFYTWICWVKHPKRNKLYYIIIIQVVYCIIRCEKFPRLKYFRFRWNFHRFAFGDRNYNNNNNNNRTPCLQTPQYHVTLYNIIKTYTLSNFVQFFCDDNIINTALRGDKTITRPGVYIDIKHIMLYVSLCP